MRPGGTELGTVDFCPLLWMASTEAQGGAGSARVMWPVGQGGGGEGRDLRLPRSFTRESQGHPPCVCRGQALWRVTVAPLCPSGARALPPLFRERPGVLSFLEKLKVQILV